MGRHVSVVMREDLFKKMEAERGRESKSSFMNHVLHTYFQWKKQAKTGHSEELLPDQCADADCEDCYPKERIE